MRDKRLAVLITTVVVLGMLLVSGCGTQTEVKKSPVSSTTTSAPSTPAATPAPPMPAEGMTYEVVRVVDGDTIEVTGGEKVRFIGIDCPEADAPGGGEATEYIKRLLEGMSVRMDKDVSDRDRYGRLLRYVYLDGTFVNEKIVSDGYAVAVEYPPDTMYATVLREAEVSAKERVAGLWKTPEVFGAE